MMTNEELGVELRRLIIKEHVTGGYLGDVADRIRPCLPIYAHGLGPSNMVVFLKGLAWLVKQIEEGLEERHDNQAQELHE